MSKYIKSPSFEWIDMKEWIKKHFVLDPGESMYEEMFLKMFRRSGLARRGHTEENIFKFLESIEIKTDNEDAEATRRAVYIIEPSQAEHEGYYQWQTMLHGIRPMTWHEHLFVKESIDQSVKKQRIEERIKELEKKEKLLDSLIERIENPYCIESFPGIKKILDEYNISNKKSVKSAYGSQQSKYEP